jgi:MFS family permease
MLFSTLIISTSSNYWLFLFMGSYPSSSLKNERNEMISSTKVNSSEPPPESNNLTPEIMKKDVTNTDPPFPYFPVSFSCLGMLAHSIAFTSPLPFVAFMIVDFHMADNLDEAGYTAGWITGMFMVGRSIGGIPWGMAADRYGRKTCLCLSMFNVFFFNILFGFSTNFYMAAASRFLLGLGNGFMAVSRTYISEVVQCREHEMRGLGYVNAFWGFGVIIGPAIGGTLARPAVQYPHLFSATGIWGRFPYLLPSLIGSLFALIAALGILFFAKETLKVSSENSSESINQMDKINSKYTLVGEDEEEDSNEGDIEMNRLQLKQEQVEEKQELQEQCSPREKKKSSSFFSFAASSSASASHEYSKVETISDESVHNPIDDRLKDKEIQTMLKMTRITTTVVPLNCDRQVKKTPQNLSHPPLLYPRLSVKSFTTNQFKIFSSFTPFIVSFVCFMMRPSPCLQ